MWQTHSAFTYKKDKCGIKTSCNLLRNKKNSTVISTSPPKNTHTYRLSEHSESVSLRRERQSNTHTHTQLWVCSNWMMYAGLSPCWRGVKKQSTFHLWWVRRQRDSHRGWKADVLAEMKANVPCRPPPPPARSEMPHNHQRLDMHLNSKATEKKKKKTEDIIGVLIMIDSFIPLLDTAAERADVEECYHWLANVKIWKKCTHLNHRIRLTAKAPWNGSESLKRRRTRFSNSPQCAFKHRSRFLDDYEIQQHYEQHRKQISEHVHKEKQKKNCHFVNCMVKLQVI